MGSDHYPVRIIVGTRVCFDKGKKIPRWKLGSAIRDSFQEISANRFKAIREDNQVDVNIFSDELVTAIIQSAKGTIPESAGARRTKNVPWWNSERSKAIKDRNKAFRQLKKFHSQDALIQYKRALAIVRRTIKTQKRTFWRIYSNSIGSEVQSSDVWGMIWRMGGIRRNYEIPVLSNGDTNGCWKRRKG